MENHTLSRFTVAHQNDYAQALREIQNGRKVSHWMWYIFPQLKGLGRSSTSDYYGIKDLEEAKAFLNDAYLGAHLCEITKALLALDSNDARAIMGSPDYMKLRSSMTLFAQANPDEVCFQSVLDRFFDGQSDSRTLRMLNRQGNTLL